MQLSLSAEDYVRTQSDLKELVLLRKNLVAFGYAVGGNGEDVHGAGAVRFDTKALGGPASEDPEHIYNDVCLVRDAEPLTQPSVIRTVPNRYTIHHRR